MIDHLSEGAAHALAKRIERHWRELGFTVTCEVLQAPQERPDGDGKVTVVGHCAIRSDLLGGLPKGYDGPLVRFPSPVKTRLAAARRRGVA